MIFVDTGVWFASADTSDHEHAIAVRLIRSATSRLVTTDYVIDEALTLLRARGRPAAAMGLGRRFFGSAMAQIYQVEASDVRAAWDVFQRFHDKDWSFTDCVSYIVMQRLNITAAFSFDHHFRQFGTVAVAP